MNNVTRVYELSDEMFYRYFDEFLHDAWRRQKVNSQPNHSGQCEPDALTISASFGRSPKPTVYGVFIPVQVIYNGITTVAIFKDGTRVISRPQPGEKFDKETGLAMCIAKHVAGGRSAFLRLVEKANDQNKKALEH